MTGVTTRSWKGVAVYVILRWKKARQVGSSAAMNATSHRRRQTANRASRRPPRAAPKTVRARAPPPPPGDAMPIHSEPGREDVSRARTIFGASQRVGSRRLGSSKR